MKPSKTAMILLLLFIGVTVAGGYVYKYGFAAGGDPRAVDYVLRDQNGNEIKLYSDLLKSKVVVMSFFFTSCKTTCDIQGRHLEKLQSALGDRMGEDVNLVSLSKDPGNDTPAVLGQWGKEHNVGRGWTLLTGELPEIRKAYIAFTGSPPMIIEHQPILLIGNSDKQRWVRIEGLTPIEKIIRIIDEVE